MKILKMRKVLLTILVFAFLASVLCVPIVSASPVGLVGEWNLDEGIGSVANDATANNNDGLLYGPTWTTGRTGNSGDYALQFDGTNDYVKIPDNALLNVGVGTWEAYLKFDALPSEMGGALGVPVIPLGKFNQYLIMASNGYKDTLATPLIERVDSIQAKIWIGRQRYVVSTAANFIQKNIWYHVAGTYDGSWLKLFVDGVKVDEYAVIGTIDSGTTQMLALGALSPNPNTRIQFFKGIIDDVRLWNVGLASLNLVFDSSSTKLAAVNTPANLKVRLTDSNGNPVQGMQIDFSSNPSLSIPSGTTGTDGYATVQTSCTVADVYTITATVSTSVGIFTAERQLVLYDPSAGFVTGGGWIDSPAGAYTPNTAFAGKATFGFVSKYQKVASVPTGNTEFQLHAADFNFKSTSLEWLVVAGTKAIFKGEGMVNSVGGYGFILTAVDESRGTFRIQIWDETGTIYDNGVQTPISGGSIVIHK